MRLVETILYLLFIDKSYKDACLCGQFLLDSLQCILSSVHMVPDDKCRL